MKKQWVAIKYDFCDGYGQDWAAETVWGPYDSKKAADARIKKAKKDIDIDEIDEIDEIDDFFQVIELTTEE